MDAVPLAALAPEIHYLLDTVEQFLSDDRFVSAGVSVTFVHDVTYVVGIPEDVMAVIGSTAWLNDTIV